MLIRMTTIHDDDENDDDDDDDVDGAFADGGVRVNRAR